MLPEAMADIKDNKTLQREAVSSEQSFIKPEMTQEFMSLIHSINATVVPVAFNSEWCYQYTHQPSIVLQKGKQKPYTSQGCQFCQIMTIQGSKSCTRHIGSYLPQHISVRAWHHELEL